jgi:hypothetical protein
MRVDVSPVKFRPHTATHDNNPYLISFTLDNACSIYLGLVQGCPVGAPEEFARAPFNFCIIFRAVFYRHKNIRLHSLTTSIKISIYIHPYKDISCPSLLPNNERKKLTYWWQPLVSKVGAPLWTKLYTQRKRDGLGGGGLETVCSYDMRAK